MYQMIKFDVNGLPIIETTYKGREGMRLEHGDTGDACGICGEPMTWCSQCHSWSSTCCQEYGTCECS